MKKKAKKDCAERYCQRIAKSGKYCNTCASRIWRAKNPMRASYITRKAHAKARGISWSLTFEQFEKFAIKENLIGHTGRTKEAYQIDRIDEDDPRGYHIDNIQKLTTTENVNKEHRRRERKKQLDFDWRYPEFTSWIKKEKQPDLETPF